MNNTKEYIKYLENKVKYYKKVSHYDYKTGVHNYRYLVDHIRKEILRSIRYDNPFAILYIDINGFKKINDELGHLKADKVLKNLATLIKDNVRFEGTVARFGGDELVVILPETGEKKADTVATRLKNLIYKELNIYISIGIVEYYKTLGNYKRVLELADKRMYKDKETK